VSRFRPTRNHVGELEIERRRLGVRFGRFERGGRLGLFGRVRIDVLLADGAGGLGDLQGASIVGLSQLQLRLVQLDLAVRLIERGLIGARIDLEQALLGLHLPPRNEIDRDQITRDTRANFDGADRFGPPREEHIVGHLTLDRRRDAHQGRLLRIHGRLLLAAGLRQGEQAQHDGPGHRDSSRARRANSAGARQRVTHRNPLGSRSRVDQRQDAALAQR
jgi:hypothetical protein